MTSKVFEKVHYNGRLRKRKYKLNGMLHRTDGPAWEEWDTKGRLIYRVFYVNGLLHGTDGPALEWRNKQGECIYRVFSVNDEVLSYEAFLAWQERQQRQRELRALVFALEHKFPATDTEREFLRHILPAHVAGEAAPCELNQ